MNSDALDWWAGSHAVAVARAARTTHRRGLARGRPKACAMPLAKPARRGGLAAELNTRVCPACIDQHLPIAALSGAAVQA